jgi:hypothetical protein
MVRSRSIALLVVVAAAGCKQKPRFDGPVYRTRDGVSADQVILNEREDALQ